MEAQVKWVWAILGALWIVVIATTGVIFHGLTDADERLQASIERLWAFDRETRDKQVEYLVAQKYITEAILKQLDAHKGY